MGAGPHEKSLFSITKLYKPKASFSSHVFTTRPLVAYECTWWLQFFLFGCGCGTKKWHVIQVKENYVSYQVAKSLSQTENNKIISHPIDSVLFSARHFHHEAAAWVLNEPRLFLPQTEADKDAYGESFMTPKEALQRLQDWAFT
jgi:hypothetical protein